MNNFVNFLLDNSGRGVGASQIVRVRTIHYINTINKYKATKAIMKTLAAFFFLRWTTNAIYKTCGF